MAEIGSDDKETARVIGIHDGARGVGWIDGMQEAAGIVAILAKKAPFAGAPDAHAAALTEAYAQALDDVLTGLQAAMAERRKT